MHAGLAVGTGLNGWNAVASGAETIEVRVDDPTPREEYYQIYKTKALSETKEGGVFVLTLTR